MLLQLLEVEFVDQGGPFLQRPDEHSLALLPRPLLTARAVLGREQVSISH